MGNMFKISRSRAGGVRVKEGDDIFMDAFEEAN